MKIGACSGGSTNEQLKPAVSAQADLRDAQVKAAAAAGRSQNYAARGFNVAIRASSAQRRFRRRLTCATRKSRPRQRPAGAKTTRCSGGSTNDRHGDDHDRRHRRPRLPRTRRGGRARRPRLGRFLARHARGHGSEARSAARRRLRGDLVPWRARQGHQDAAAGAVRALRRVPRRLARHSPPPPERGAGIRRLCVVSRRADGRRVGSAARHPRLQRGGGARQSGARVRRRPHPAGLSRCD